VSDYEKGIEAADRATAGYEVQGTMTDRQKVLIGRRALYAFIAVQPELWWCAEHLCHVCVTCEKVDHCVDVDSAWESTTCRMVKARIVVTP
jgi:hypothetical protein